MAENPTTPNESTETKPANDATAKAEASVDEPKPKPKKVKSDKGLFASLWEATRSPEPKDRRMGLTFFTSLIGATVCAVLFTRIIVSRRMERLKFEERLQAELLEKRRAAAPNARDAFRVSLGIFSFDLRVTPGMPVPKGVQNIAQAELVVECSTERTCEWIKENQDIVRDRVQGVLASLSREDLLAPEGKRRVRELIIRSINPVLPHGKVEEVYFTKLLVS